jgi:hypothetical protein
MRFQITGHTTTPEFEKCIEVLTELGYTTSRDEHGRIAVFDTRAEAERALRAMREVAPEANFGLSEAET